MCLAEIVLYGLIFYLIRQSEIQVCSYGSMPDMPENIEVSVCFNFKTHLWQKLRPRKTLLTDMIFGVSRKMAVIRKPSHCNA